MRIHTNDFKNAIKTLGRELDSKITYTENNVEIELGGEQLNSISLHYEGAILKSVMKQLDIDSNVDIPLNTILNAQFGVKVNGTYEYLNLGNFVVYKSEKQEDLDSYKITCYDKLLYSMKEYETTGTYPITIRDYIKAICDKLGLEFANENENFTNYDKVIQDELYLDEEGNSLNYTFRDVLDELAEVTASTICINNNDKLEIRYPKLVGDTTKVSGTEIHITDAIKQGILYDGVNNITQTNSNLPFEMELNYITQSGFETIDEEFLKDVNVNFGELYGPINTVVLTRAEADKISHSIPEDLPDEDKIAIEIKDNQIMNWEDREDYIDDILSKLYGLEYYINDFASTGVCYLDLCDMYGVSIDGNVYKCLMLNDEINITQGLEENIYTEMPEKAEVEYKYTNSTDKAVREASIIIDKKISQVDIKGKTINLTADDINITSNNFSVTNDGKITATAGDIAGYELVQDEDGNRYLMARAYPEYDFDETDLQKVENYINGLEPLTPEELEKYDVNKDGEVDITDLVILSGIVSFGVDTTHPVEVRLSSSKANLLESVLGSGISLKVGNRLMFNAGPWGTKINDGDIYGERILFEDDSVYGETGTLTLADQIDNGLGLTFLISSYKYIDFIGVDNNGTPGAYIRIMGIDLDTAGAVSIQMIEAGTNGTYIRKTKYTLTNGNELVPSNYGYIYILNSGSVQTNRNQNYIGIKKIIGYK